MSARSILHVDMDAFYASVEQRDNPELRGKPLVVGGTTNRGVVAAASYEAREYGIRSAMPMRDACRRCPDLLRVRPRMAHYKTASKQVFDVFRSFTPLVEGLSLVAKIASDLDKPDGLTVLYPDDYERKLDPLPVSVIPGIGRETLKRLDGTGILTLRDLRLAEDRVLEPVFGRFSRKTRDRASGIDDRPVTPSRAEKSISTEETYDTDLVARGEMERELLKLAERTAARLRKANLAAGTVQIKIRQSDFSTFTRQRKMRPPADGTDQLYTVARDLLGTWLSGNPGTQIRLLGVGGSNLVPAEQPDLFAVDNPASPIDKTVDEIRDRFGTDVLERARTLDRG